MSDDDTAKALSRSAWIVAESNDSIVSVDTEGRVRAWNQGATDLHGFTADEMMGESIARLFAPSEHPLFERMLQTVLEGDSIHLQALTLTHKEGHQVHVNLSLAPIHDDRGVVVEAVGLAKDITAQVETDRKLRDAGSLLSAACALTGCGGWQLDARTSELQWTDEVFRLHGLPPSGNIPLDVAIRFYHPDDRVALERALERALGDGEPYDLELRLTTAQGRSRLTRSLCRPVFEGGRVVRLVGAFIDITARRKSEQALIESEAKWRTLAENTPDHVLTLDANLEIQWANRALRGVDPESLMGLRLPELTSRPDEIAERLNRALELGQPTSFETGFAAPDGSTGEFSTRVVPLNVPGEEVLLVNSRDVAEERQREREILASRARLEALTGAVDVHLFELDRAGTVLYVNRTWESLPTADVVGTQLLDWFPAELHDRIAAFLQAAFSSTRPVTIEYTSPDPQGRSRRYLASASLVPGQAERVVLSALDITKRFESQELLAHSQKRLRGLAMRLQTVREEERLSLARELHDQVGGFLTVLGMDLYRLKDPSTSRRDVTTTAAHMLDLMDDAVSSVQGITARLRPPMLEVMGLSAAIRWHVEHVRDAVDFACHLEVEDDEPATVGPDRSLALFRVLQEALTNVIRHAAASHVWIRLDLAAEAATLEVRDDGVGIDPDRARLTTSFGVTGMEERLAALGGTLELSPDPRGGTLLRARIPVSGVARQG